MSELADRPLRVPEETIVRHWLRMARWFANLRLYSRLSSRYEIAHKPLMRLYRRCFYDGLTRSGKIILFCSLLVFLLSYRVGSGFLLLTAAFGLTLIIWSAVLGFCYRPRVTVQRQAPEVTVAGELLTSQIRVTNDGPRALYNFAVRELIIPLAKWPAEWLRPHSIALAPGQHTSVAVSFTPQKRGVLQLSGVAVQSYFPFFLTRHTARVASAAEVAVLPETLKTSVPSLRQLAEVASKRLTQSSDNARKGPAMEYAYSRAYQVGDSLRRLDHRASSRRGEPMSKIFEGAEEIRRDQVYLMVDLTLAGYQAWQRRPVDEEPLDQRLALAVEIGLSAQNEGFTLAALATGNEWHEVSDLLQFYRHIATAPPQKPGSQDSTRLPDSCPNELGLHILVLGRWDDNARALVERWQQAGILVLVFLLAESEQDAGTLPEGSQYVEVART